MNINLLQAVLRPWEEEPNPLNEETVKTLSMEVVREQLLDRVHEVNISMYLQELSDFVLTNGRLTTLFRKYHIF